MTNGGGELTDDKFRKLVDKHGYTAIMSAPDGSHQNGVVERPHRTLKERIRCMLYSARLGTEFWADTLMHATWLYNQTYHKAIGMTPFQMYTGRIPTLDSFLFFQAVTLDLCRW